MKSLPHIFTPTKNRRLNELVGFLLLVSALLLFLALASYSPLDPSLNTAANPTLSGTTRNWVGRFGSYGSDLALQVAGIAAFLFPAYLCVLGMRWFRSRPVESPIAKTVGSLLLLVFLAAFLALLPWHWRWLHAIPVEGMLGRITGDALVHYFNLIGAYIVAVSAMAVALYLCTAFSFGALQLWSETRFSFVYAAWDRINDWRMERARKQAQKDLEKKRAATRPTVTV